MSIRLSDTQKITNVPNARDIGQYINLNNSQLPGANNPRPAYPTIQSGFATQTDTYQLIDAIDFELTAFRLTIVGFPYDATRYKRHKIVFSKCDPINSASTVGLTFSNNTNATHSYEYEQRVGSTAGYNSGWTTGQTQIILGNSSGFEYDYYGITGEVIIDSSRTSGAYAAGNNRTRPICYWNLAGTYQYRTTGHGTLDNGYPPDALYLRLSYPFYSGSVSFYGLPRN
jgi:hypothetical protein